MSRYLNKTYDDRDTTDLKYEGNWFLKGSYIASNVGETGTLSSTSDLNANVTFTFPIPAIAFYYYGIPRCCGGLYGICVDCDPVNPNFIPINAVNRTDDGKNPPIVLYSQRFDTPGIHEIIIRNENDTSVNPSGNSQLTIDRLDLEVVDTSVTTVVSDSSSTATPTSGVETSLTIFGSSSSSSSVSSSSLESSSSSATSSSTSATPPLPGNSSSSPSPPQSTHSLSISAIVGGALGGAFVLVALILFLCWRRRRNESTGSRDPSPYVAPQATSLPPLPSTLTSMSPPTKKSSKSATISSGAARRYPKRYGYAPRPGKGTQPSFPTASPPVVSSESTSQPGSSQLRREQDAGPVPTEAEGSTLPPEYNEVFANAIRSSNIPPG